MRTRWIVSFAIDGNGWAEVEAESQEQAEAMVSSGPWLTKPEVDEWNINSDRHRGGYVEAREN